MESRISKTPLLFGDALEDKRQELRDYFHHTFSLYESLFSTINNDKAYFIRPEPLRHPLIFYFGHTASFFINKLILAKYIDRRINESFESTFAVGVDEMSWDDLNDEHYDWPRVDEVMDYRSKVRQEVDNFIASMPIELPIKQDSPAWVVLMGIEHERIHLETSSVIIRMLPIEDVNKHPQWLACPDFGPAPQNAFVDRPSVMVNLGKPEMSDTYGWDNEYGSKKVSVDQFKTSKYLVSNQEYLEFVVAGGYQDLSIWTEEGAAWLNYSRAEMPRFWLKRGNQYFQRNMLEEVELPLNWPVEVNYLEAKAFCNWKSKITRHCVRLPKEAEWHTLRDLVETDQAHWVEAPGNINLEHFASSCPIDRFETQGIFDIIGNVWQWTETPIDGFSGFKVHELYDDFSTPTFDGKHNVFKGGSWISTGNEATKHARYAFRRHFFQHAGFRYIQSDSLEDSIDTVNIYETDESVARYLEFHYGEKFFGVENYPLACVQACLKYLSEHPKKAALDLGCSVGRASFELARYFDHVDGVDFSARFIQHGFQLKNEGEVRYTIQTEGELVAYRDANLKRLGYSAFQDKVEFAQGDACNLKPTFSGYDLIFCANLIDRLYDPFLFLSSIPNRLNSDGILVLTSPYTWLEEYTEKAKWLGGIKVNGENFTTLDGLKKALNNRFDLLGSEDIPFVLQETQRKFQHTIAQMTVWKLKV